MYIRLLVPYHNCSPGDVVDLPATVARHMIEKHQAHGGNININKVKPVDASIPTQQRQKETYKVVEPEKKEAPTQDNTVKEIKAWLDKHGIEYNARAKKSELLKLV